VAVPGTDRSGFFAVADAGEVDAAVQVAGDPRAGPLTLFTGRLTELEIEIAFVDTRNGRTRRLRHPAGSLCGLRHAWRIAR
jgi:hypothetical protein